MGRDLGTRRGGVSEGGAGCVFQICLNSQTGFQIVDPSFKSLKKHGRKNHVKVNISTRALFVR